MIDTEIMTTLVNIAQIISAIGTAGAVWVSLHLARRPERQRPKIFISLRDTVRIGPGDSHTRKLQVCIDIVNAGILPFTVRHGSLLLHNPRGRTIWGHSLLVRHLPSGLLIPSSTVSSRLEHGQEFSNEIDISTELHWKHGTKSLGLFGMQRPTVTMLTTLGTHFTARMSRNDYLAVREYVRNESATNVVRQ